MSAQRVLIVDDNRGLAETVADILSEKGYEVDVASSGVQALIAWRARTPDLVVLDVDLPDIRGLTLARRLAARAADCFLVVMSAREPQLLAPLCEELGAVLLPKPFSPSHLLAAVRRIFQGEAARRPTGRAASSATRRLLGPRKPRALLQHSGPSRRTR